VEYQAGDRPAEHLPTPALPTLGRQHLVLAFVYNARLQSARHPGGSRCALPRVRAAAQPVTAAAAMSLSSMSVTGNSLRLRRTRVWLRLSGPGFS